MSGREIAIGVVGGLLGVTFTFFLLGLFVTRAVPIIVPIRELVTAEPFGLSFFPKSDPTADLRCTAGTGDPEWCRGATSRSYQFFLALLFQGMQSVVLAVWDTMVFGGGVFAMTAVGRAILARS